jgi:hypothetical protein
MQRKGLFVALLFGLVIAFVGWSLWSARERDRRNSRTLADSSVVQLKEEAFEHKIRVRTGHRWQDYLGTILPEPWAKKLGAGFIIVGDSNRFAAVLKIQWKGYFSGPGPSPDLRATTFDQHGCEFCLSTPNQSFSWFDAETIIFVFAEYPRREKTIGLRLYQSGTNQTWKTVTEFQIPNPKSRSVPARKAEAKPIKRTIEDQEFALTELKSGILARTWPPQPLKPGEAPGVVINFRLPSNGDWELADFKGISDALGQTVGRGSYSSAGLRNGEFQVCVDGGLCVQEAAWKVELEFMRKDRFPEKELWTLRAVPAPGTGEPTPHPVETNFFGAELRFQTIASPQSTYAKQIRSVRLDIPLAHIVCHRLPTGTRIKFVGGIDNAGRKVVGTSTGGNGLDYLFGLKIPEGARTVDLTFAVTKPVAVTYLVKPERFTAEELKKMRQR